MGHSKVGPVELHALGISQKARYETDGQLKHLILERCVIKRDPPIHYPSIANMLLEGHQAIQLIRVAARRQG
jgi:hypothetical protein